MSALWQAQSALLNAPPHAPPEYPVTRGEPAVHEMRQMPVEIWQTLPGAQSELLLQNPLCCQSGWQKWSSPHASLLLVHDEDVQSARQRPETQCSPLEQPLVAVHSVGSFTQRLPVQT